MVMMQKTMPIKKRIGVEVERRQNNFNKYDKLSAATSDCWRRRHAPHRHQAHHHRSNHPGMHRSPAAPVMSDVLQDVLTIAPKHTLLLKHRSPLAQNNHSQAAAQLLCGPSSQQTTTTTAQQEADLCAQPTAHRCLR